MTVGPTARTIRAALAIALALGATGCASVGWIPGVDDGTGTESALPAEDAAAEIAQLEARAMQDPAEPYWPFRIGEIRAAAGELPEAEAALRLALLRDPDHAPSLGLLFRTLFGAGRHDEAIDLLETAQQRQPLPEALGVELALHYDAVGAPEVAENLAESLANRLDDWSNGGSALTYVQLRGEGFAEAEDVAKRALDAEQTAVNHNNYGIAKLYRGEPTVAREHFVKATKLDPDLPGPLYNLAIVDRFYRFDDEGARTWYRRYRELSDDDPDGLLEALAVELAENADEEAQP